MRELIDYIAFGTFVVFCAALVALFLWLVIQVFLGKVQIFSVLSSRRKKGDTGAVSLSKLQMFIWTVVMVFGWLYLLVREPGTFPELPNQALMLMGISVGGYLGAKQISASSNPKG